MSGTMNSMLHSLLIQNAKLPNKKSLFIFFTTLLFTCISQTRHFLLIVSTLKRQMMWEEEHFVSVESRANNNNSRMPLDVR